MSDLIYCPECGACGVDGCCGASKCKENRCLYGESYAVDFEYYGNMVEELYELAQELDPERTEEIFNRLTKKHYNHDL